MNKKVKTAGLVMALLAAAPMSGGQMAYAGGVNTVSYPHLRAHETELGLV